MKQVVADLVPRGVDIISDEEVRHGIEMMPDGTPEERQSKEQAMQTFLRDLQDGSDDELDVMEAGGTLTLTLIGIISTPWMPDSDSTLPEP